MILNIEGQRFAKSSKTFNYEQFISHYATLIMGNQNFILKNELFRKVNKESLNYKV